LLPATSRRDATDGHSAGHKLARCDQGNNPMFKTTLSIAVTGIDHWLILDPTVDADPCVRVAIVPPDRGYGVQAVVPFGVTEKPFGSIPGPLEARVRAFIALNRAVLLDYWPLDNISTDEFIAKLRPIPA
jgi:hypothetical protein